ncbi:MAG: Uncharacterised protein [Synechococcus sp. MIT S9220]|nr:MAG: Uncharacterised protein [Synechococcus sp. MIT S9220]
MTVQRPVDAVVDAMAVVMELVGTVVVAEIATAKALQRG